jgi:hypothetical protein
VAVELGHLIHALSENRNGLIVDLETKRASGRAKPEAARAMLGRTARGKGHALSLKRRKMIEEAFGWTKTIGGLRKTRVTSLARVKAQALRTFAAYNLTRMSRLFGWRALPA